MIAQLDRRVQSPVAVVDPLADFSAYVAGMSMFDAGKALVDCPTPAHYRGWWAANRAQASATMPAGVSI